MRPLTLILFLAIPALAQEAAKSVQTVGSEPRNWRGSLVDAVRTNCGPEVERAAPAEYCPVSMRTTAFGLVLPDGKFVKFDEGGNGKALEALRKSRKGSKAVLEYWRTGKSDDIVRANVNGTLTSETLNVESIRID